MKINDAVFGLLLMVLGAVVLGVVQGYPRIPGQQVGPALFPGLIAAGLCVGGALLLLRGWRERKAVPWFTGGDWMRSPRHLVAFAVLIGSIVFYMLVSQALGFVITSTLILSLLFYVLKVGPLKSLTVALLASLVIHLMFYKLLRVPLPWGLLQPYAW